MHHSPVSIISITRVVLEKCKFTGLIEISFLHVDLRYFFRIVHWSLKASKFVCTWKHGIYRINVTFYNGNFKNVCLQNRILCHNKLYRFFVNSFYVNTNTINSNIWQKIFITRSTQLMIRSKRKKGTQLKMVCAQSSITRGLSWKDIYECKYRYCWYTR